MRSVILASASPRRRELLSLVLKDFRVIESAFDESLVPHDLSPAEHVSYCAMMKARDVASSNTDSLVIGADTVVVVGDEILGKPDGLEDAAAMLGKLSGKTHQVYTGVVVIAGGAERTGVERTDVTFDRLSDDEIAAYVATGEPLDKAGAYAIQGKAAVLIKCIDGCYSNVVGLPLHLLSSLLSQFGIEVLLDP